MRDQSSADPPEIDGERPTRGEGAVAPAPGGRVGRSPSLRDGEGSDKTLRSGPSLSDFTGLWHLTRTIDDRRAGQTGHFTGTATFTPDPSGLTYDERGQLTLGTAPPLEATRRYLWRADGPRIAVLFHDGRPFHGFGPGASDASHWCDPDTYRVVYDFACWPEWTVTWEVRGPRKDYRMVSRYRRA